MSDENPVHPLVKEAAENAARSFVLHALIKVLMEQNPNIQARVFEAAFALANTTADAMPQDDPRRELMKTEVAFLCGFKLT